MKIGKKLCFALTGSAFWASCSIDPEHKNNRTAYDASEVQAVPTTQLELLSPSVFATILKTDSETKEFVEAFRLPAAYAPVDASLEAKAAQIVAYMKQRPARVLRAITLPVTTAARADMIAQGTFIISGVEVAFPGNKIVWNYYDGVKVNSDQWAVQLNRHQFWLNLAYAYSKTGNTSYAKAFVAQLKSWLDAGKILIAPEVPGYTCGAAQLDWREERIPYIDGAYASNTRCELALSAGNRMSDVWWIVYDLFKKEPAFDGLTQLRMLSAMARHGKYLAETHQFSVTTNHGVFQTAGLLHVATFLPELARERMDSKKWASLAWQRFEQLAKHQIGADGVQSEYSPNYHGTVVTSFLDALEINKAFPTASSVSIANLRKTAQDMTMASLKMSMPYRFERDAKSSYAQPGVNDSGWIGIGQLVQRAAAMFTEVDYFKRFELHVNAAADQPVTATHDLGDPLSHLPNAGWTVMRTGWKPSDSALFFESGPYGVSHQHEDQLNLLLTVGGEPILGEVGKHDYDGSEWYSFSMSSFGHNVVNVDGLGQNRMTKTATWGPDSTPTQFEPRGSFDLVAGQYLNGFGPENALKVVHDRQVIHFKPGYWLVIDTMISEDGKPHKYQSLFNLDGKVTLDLASNTFTARRAQANGEDATLRIIAASPLPFDVRPFVGYYGADGTSLDSRLPRYIRGFMGSDTKNMVGSKYVFKRRVTAASFVWTDANPVSIVAWILAPDVTGSAAAPVVYHKDYKTGTGAVLAIRIASADGSRDAISVRASPDGSGTGIVTKVIRKPVGGDWGQPVEIERRIKRSQ